MPLQDYAPGVIEGDGWGTLTPHAANLLEFKPVAVCCGATGGTIVAIDADGNQATFTVAAGQVLRIRPVRILATSTATPLIGLKR
jgi:hypothetical protein